MFSRTRHAVLLSGALLLAAGHASAQADASDPLYVTIAALDSAVFDAFNKCSDANELRKHASYFAPKTEFYHDNGGATWDRDSMIANTRANACGNYTRELIPGSLRVYPIKGFGAIAQGAHRFCQRAAQKCEGIADFIMIWSDTGGQWQITRTLSYGHRAAP